MKKISIIADSTCDLSPELVREFDISVLPLLVTLGEKSLKDGVEISPDEIYAWADKNGTTPKTAAPLPASAQEIFQAHREEDIIAFTISSEMSSTYQLLMTTAEEFPDTRITVIDSRSLSTGNGLLVLLAARMIRQGKPYEEIVAAVKDTIPRVRAGFIVDSVQYLYKGGRCSAVAAFGATALKLHPTLAIRDGLIKVDKKIRGEIGKATMKYATDLEEGLKNAEDDVVFITHSGAKPEVIAQVREYLEGMHYFRNIYITRAGGVISSHCGAGTLGVLFISK